MAEISSQQKEMQKLKSSFNHNFTNAPYLSHQTSPDITNKNNQSNF